MTYLKKLGIALFSASLVLPVGSVIGATQGNKGGNSGGTATINAGLNSKIIISGINDIDLGTFDEGSSPSKNMNFCVGMNKKKSERYYKIKATSNYQSGGTFRLRLDGGDQSQSEQVIKYNVKLSAENVSDRSLSSGSYNDNSGNGFKTDNDLGCNNGENQKLKLSVKGSSTQGNIAGDYTDTLTLLVSPL